MTGARPAAVAPREAVAPRLAIAILVAFALVLGAPLVTGRFLAEDDTPRHLAIAAETAANQRAGLLLPWWSVDLNAGLGAPVPLLYPPLLPALHAALANLTGLALPRLVGWVAVAALAASGLAAYGWLREIGLAHGALGGALLYMAGPYRLFDVYLRGALAEHAAYVYPPLLLWILAARLTPLVRTAAVALASAGLMLTNYPMTVLFGILLAVWVLATRAGRARAREAIAGAALGAGIAAFALTPAALAPVWLDTSRLYGASGHFAPSSNAVLGRATAVENDVVFLATAALSALVAWPARKRPEARFWIRTLVVVALAVTPLGAWAWDFVPPLVVVQFPVRATGIVLVAAAALAALGRPSRALLATALAMPLALPYFALAQPGRLLDRPEPPATAPGTRFPPPRRVYEVAGDLEVADLANPRYVEPFFNPKAMGLATHRFLAGHPSPLDRLGDQAGLLAAEPGARITTTEWTRRGGAVRFAAARDDVFLLRQLVFPGMKVELDGAPVPVVAEPTTGMMAVRVGPGEHEVRFAWHLPRPLVVARGISLGALALTLGLLVAGLAPRGSSALPETADA